MTDPRPRSSTISAGFIRRVHLALADAEPTEGAEFRYTDAQIADDIGSSVRSVGEAIRALCEHGAIAISYRYGNDKNARGKPCGSSRSPEHAQQHPSPMRIGGVR